MTELGVGLAYTGETIKCSGISPCSGISRIYCSVVPSRCDLAYLAALDAGNANKHQPLLNLIAGAVEERLEMILTACGELPPTKALPLRELAILTGIEVDYLGWLARAGRIAAVKRSGRWYSTAEAVGAYQQEVTTKEQPRGRPRKGQ
jgi:hypothetical protein